MKLFSFLTASAAVALSAAAVSDAQTTLLKETRSKITFPVYSAAQRQLVADQAKLYFEVYVNRESKLTFYGKDVDPNPKIASIVQRAANLTDEGLHTELSSLFLSLRDFHTNYILPRPYSCYRVLLPFTLKEIYSETTARKVAIDSIRAELTAQVPETSKLGLGDVLVTYNGKTVDELFKILAAEQGGANNFGGFQSAVGILVFRSLNLYRLPKEDSVELVFQRPDKSRYTVTLPWLATPRAGCLPASATAAPQAASSPSKAAKAAFKNPQSIHLFKNEFNEIFGTDGQRQIAAAASPIPPLTDTAEPIVKYTTFQNKNGKFGYILLTSFSPSVISSNDVIVLFRDLLTKQLVDTDGLIVDIRGNGGGNIAIADSLTQLFTAGPIDPAPARGLYSPLNGRIFTEAPTFIGSDWDKAYRATAPGSTYTVTARFTSPEIANFYGRVYFKPVAVLTNADCYSACDLWSAAMQDSGAATIWNEDLLTGAGGANVVDTAFFTTSLAGLPNNPFKPLPGNQNMRVGYRQTVRRGKNFGRLIEDRGILADRRARPLLTDLLGSTSSQYDKITQEIKYQLPDYQVAFYTEADFQSDLPLSSSDVFFRATSRGVNKIVVKQEGTVISTNPISGYNTLKPVSLFISKGENSAPGIANVRIEGYTPDGTLGFSTSRIIRITPAAVALPLGSTFNWDFSVTKTNGAAIFTVGPQKEGWNKVGSSLVFGNGVQYVDNISSAATLFLDFTSARKITLSFAATVVSEQDFDFFTVRAVPIGAAKPVPKVFYTISGAVGPISQTVDLSEYAGGKIELQFDFTSDGGVTDVGATLSKVSLTVA